MAREQYPVILTSSETIAPNVRHLSFQREDGESLSYIPGQFINLHFEYEGNVCQRSYSLANAPEQANSLDIAVAYVDGGKASKHLFGLQPGDKIKLSGPFGRLVLKEDDVSRYVLVATGTGVAPYRAMLPEIAQRLAADSNLQVYLVFGVRKQEDILYCQEFANFATSQPNFQFIACCSRESASVDLPDYIHCSRVTTALTELNLDPSQDIVYLCGNPDMVDDAFQLCSEKGFDFKTVRREKYVFSK